MPRVRHDPSKNFVGFNVGEVTYAVRIELVREIVNPLSVVALPRAPESVKGVADYRGEVVPVIDLRERFGLDAVAVTRKSKWIVVDVSRAGDVFDPKGLGSGPPSASAGGRFAALVVDAVTEVFGGAEGVRPSPPLGVGDELRGIAGVTHHGRRLVFILDLRQFGALTADVRDSVAPGALGTT